MTRESLNIKVRLLIVAKIAIAPAGLRNDSLSLAIFCSVWNALIIYLSIEVIICLKIRVAINMSTLEEIEAAILKLPSDEFQQLMQWFFDLDYQRWDKQLEKDIANGKLENLAQEAIDDFEAGNARPI